MTRKRTPIALGAPAAGGVGERGRSKLAREEVCRQRAIAVWRGNREGRRSGKPCRHGEWSRRGSETWHRMPVCRRKQGRWKGNEGPGGCLIRKRRKPGLTAHTEQREGGTRRGGGGGTGNTTNKRRASRSRCDCQGGGAS